VLQGDGIDLGKEEYYARYLGYDDVGLFQALVRDRRLPVTARTIDHWILAKADIVEHLLSSDSVLFPGAIDCVLRCAAQVPLAIASGALAPEIELVLHHAGLRSAFQAIASASDGVPGKPAPDLYELAMAKAGFRDGTEMSELSCVAIEDSHWGIAAAHAAGLKCIAVTHTYAGSELTSADAVVDHLDAITIDLLRSVLGDNDQDP
jgi:HAD superfamily hydrolase (TIGR01509 family)